MKKIQYLVITMLLIIVLAACGQGPKNNVQEDIPNSNANLEQNEQAYETENGATESAHDDTNTAEEEVEVLNNINLYFSGNDLMNIYRVEYGKEFTKDEDGIESALQLWIEGPSNEDLVSLVPEGVTVQSVKDIDGVAHVSFSKELTLANLGSTGEADLIEQIVMVVEQFGYKEVFILIDGEIDTEFLGHVGLGNSFTANSPKDYNLYNE